MQRQDDIVALPARDGHGDEEAALGGRAQHVGGLELVYPQGQSNVPRNKVKVSFARLASRTVDELGESREESIFGFLCTTYVLGWYFEVHRDVRKCSYAGRRACVACSLCLSHTPDIELHVHDTP